MSTSNIGDGNLSDYYTPQAANQPQQTAITAFLAKLWALVNDPSCDDLIAWDPSGGSFHVFDQSRFAREILPRYFKHNNFASFIRQLNMYGFRKISTIEHGSLKSEHDDIEFAHPHFIRGHETLLELIKRRAPDNQQKLNVHVTKTEPISAATPSASATAAALASSALVSTHYADTKPARSLEVSQLLDDVRTLQSKQTSLSDKLFHMQDENQALWREISILKQKHSKQQQIVSKLMEFLLHFLTNSTQTQRPSVEQSSTDQHQQAAAKHAIVNPHIATNNLKRKPAALMLSEESNKRPNLSSRQHIIPKSISIERQPGIIINELTDNDTGGWSHTTDTSPLVDLVPSPPPVQAQLLPALSQSTSIQSLDDPYQQQKQSSNFEWPRQTNDICDALKFTQQNNSYKTIESENNDSNSFVPDFFLNTDNDNHGSKATIGQIDEANLAGINPVNIDADYFFDMI